MSKPVAENANSTGPTEPLDRELNLKAIISFTVILTAVVVVAVIFLYFYAGSIRDAQYASDPEPSVLLEARVQGRPSGPLLQADPLAEMAALAAEEARELSTYAWIDEEAGLARIPVARAMELMLEETSLNTTTAPETADAESSSIED